MIPVAAPPDSATPNRSDFGPSSRGAIVRRKGAAPYRSLRSKAVPNDEDSGKSPSTATPSKTAKVPHSALSTKHSDWRASDKNSATAAKQSKNSRNGPPNKKSVVIEAEQLSALVAGDHVEITTKHNQIIDGIVYCSIPQRPPLCIIHQYLPAQTKNVYIVSLNEISRCIKFDGAKAPKRDVELRPIGDEQANAILERNLLERKAKMDTLNIAVEDSTQSLFDFLYRTLPNKVKWDGTTIA